MKPQKIETIGMFILLTGSLVIWLSHKLTVLKNISDNLFVNIITYGFVIIATGALIKIFSFSFENNPTIKKIYFSNILKQILFVLSLIIITPFAINVIYYFARGITFFKDIEIPYLENTSLLFSLNICFVLIFLIFWSRYTLYNIELVKFALMNKKGINLEISKAGIFSLDRNSDIKFDDKENVIYINIDEEGLNNTYLATLTITSYLTQNISSIFTIKLDDSISENRDKKVVKTEDFIIKPEIDKIREIIDNMIKTYNNFVFTPYYQFRYIKSYKNKIEAIFIKTKKITFEKDEDFLYNSVIQFSYFVKKLKSTV